MAKVVKQNSSEPTSDNEDIVRLFPKCRPRYSPTESDYNQNRLIFNNTEQHSLNTLSSYSITGTNNTTSSTTPNACSHSLSSNSLLASSVLAGGDNYHQNSNNIPHNISRPQANTPRETTRNAPTKTNDNNSVTVSNPFARHNPFNTLASDSNTLLPNTPAATGAAGRKKNMAELRKHKHHQAVQQQQHSDLAHENPSVPPLGGGLLMESLAGAGLGSGNNNPLENASSQTAEDSDTLVPGGIASFGMDSGDRIEKSPSSGGPAHRGGGGGGQGGGHRLVYNSELDIGYHINSRTAACLRESRIEIAGGRELYSKSKNKPSKKRHSDEVIYHPPPPPHLACDTPTEEVKRFSGEVLYDDKFVQYLCSLQGYGTTKVAADQNNKTTNTNATPPVGPTGGERGGENNTAASNDVWGQPKTKKMSSSSTTSESATNVVEEPKELPSGQLVYETAVHNAEVVYDDIGDLSERCNSNNMARGALLTSNANSTMSQLLLAAGGNTHSSSGRPTATTIITNSGGEIPGPPSSLIPPFIGGLQETHLIHSGPETISSCSVSGSSPFLGASSLHEDPPSPPSGGNGLAGRSTSLRGGTSEQKNGADLNSILNKMKPRELQLENNNCSNGGVTSHNSSVEHHSPSLTGGERFPKVIGNLPIAEYDGSPRRYGPRPGYPHRVVVKDFGCAGGRLTKTTKGGGGGESDDPPSRPASSPTGSCSSQQMEDFATVPILNAYYLNSFGSEENGTCYLPIEDTSSSVDCEHDGEDSMGKKEALSSAALLQLEPEFDDLEYRLYRLNAGNSYIGKRLAQSSETASQDSPKSTLVGRYVGPPPSDDPEQRCPSVVVKSNTDDEREASEELRREDRDEPPSHHHLQDNNNSHDVDVDDDDKESNLSALAYLPNERGLMLLHERVHQHTLSVDLGQPGGGGGGTEHDRESLSTFPGTEDLGETEVGEQVDNTRNFTLSPETTECDSNDVESEVSFEGSLNSSGRMLSSMPILEDGLSSGHSSDGDAESSTAAALHRHRSASSHRHHVANSSRLLAGGGRPSSDHLVLEGDHPEDREEEDTYGGGGGAESTRSLGVGLGHDAQFNSWGKRHLMNNGHVVTNSNNALAMIKQQIDELDEDISKRSSHKSETNHNKLKVEEYLRKHTNNSNQQFCHQLPEADLGYFESLDRACHLGVGTLDPAAGGGPHHLEDESSAGSSPEKRCHSVSTPIPRESVNDVIREIKHAIQMSKNVHLLNPSSAVPEVPEESSQPIWVPRLSQSGGKGEERTPDGVNEHQPEDEECDTDQETDRLLGAQRASEDKSLNDDKNSGSGSVNGKKKSASKEVLVHEPAVLIEGVLFRARYLGSTQLVCEGQPTKATRMMQAEEAVSRIKAPEGEAQPSTEVDLFISTEKIMVLNTDLKEIMMDHSLRTISYIADIGDLVVLMARRRILSSSDDVTDVKIKRTPKMICHVFESEEAQFIAQSIGQAFQVAYMEFLKANGIEDSSFVKEMDYQEVLNSQEIFGNELEMFAKKEKQKEVVVPKQKSEILGMVIVESGWGSMLPTVVIANMAQTGPAARCGQLNIGDQIIAINGVSLVGLPLSTCQNYIKNTKNQTVVKLTVVPCAPVVEVKIKRPDTKYQLGFSVQNGVICSLLRGGIAERGGVRVGHRIIEINGQSVVAVPHEKIVNLLATSVGEILMKTMPTSMFRLLTGQESPLFI